ncbi:MAG: hypothetical protein M1131_06210 [Actinobacteria bacterium]|nr:hypothetical protein [Actinomycetota bacterium]MCL6095892.1 hypothetical protein [Actinomycetota bacterium]
MDKVGRTGELDHPVLLQEGLGFRLGRLSRALRTAWANTLEDLSISPPQAAVLRALKENPGSGIRALARTLSSDPMNVKHVVDELQRRSLLASATEPGTRRTRKLYLSEEGERLADRVNERIRAQEDWFDQVLGTSGSEQLRLLVSALELALGVTERDGDRNLRP